MVTVSPDKIRGNKYCKTGDFRRKKKKNKDHILLSLNMRKAYYGESIILHFLKI